MQDEIELKACPHCGGEATLASPAQWRQLMLLRNYVVLQI